MYPNNERNIMKFIILGMCPFGCYPFLCYLPNFLKYICSDDFDYKCRRMDLQQR